MQMRMVRAARADSKTHLGHHPRAMPGHHPRLGVDQTMAALGVSPGHSNPAARAQSCLTRAGHRPAVWPHEMPDSGISHRNTGSSPCSGTEAGDISPVLRHLNTPREISPLWGRITHLSVQVSDALNPHELPFAGMLYRHPRSASGRGGCFVSFGGSPFCGFVFSQRLLPMVTTRWSWQRSVCWSGS
jgi:hypothetical protein